MKHLLITLCLLLCEMATYGNVGNNTIINVKSITLEKIDDQNQNNGARGIIPTIQATLNLNNGNLFVSISRYNGTATVYIYGEENNLVDIAHEYVMEQLSANLEFKYSSEKTYTIIVQLDNGSYIGHF